MRRLTMIRRLILGVIMASFPLALHPLYGDELYGLDKPPSLRLVIAGPPGSTYDRYGRLVARHLGRHLPGRPVVTAQYMPGASGKVAANYLYNAAPRDGSVIGIVLKVTPMTQMLGDANIKYDAARFNWIGSPARLGETLVVWHRAGARSLDDAKHRVISIGATSPSGAHYIYPKLANALLGTKFRIITGYPGGPQINLAMERGEVEGRGAEPWAEWKASKPEWVRERKIIPIMQMALHKHSELPDVPLMAELPMGHEARLIFDLVSISGEIGRPFVAPPEVPPARVAQLRDAFHKTMADADFIADAARVNAEVDPIGGDELTALARRLLATSPDVIAMLKSALATKE
jgi:tripartite-type tricarboxylate transporter receptor subunit TctC